MRILLHDYTGHAFQADLARHLAKLGHRVKHVSCNNFPAPKGLLNHQIDDPDNLDFDTLELPGSFDKYNFIRRWRLERAYGKALAKLIENWHADVLLICNTPLEPLKLAFKSCEKTNTQKVFWLQDIYSTAINRYLTQRLGLLGQLIGSRYRHLESHLSRRADAIISITSGFLPTLDQWGVHKDRTHVIPNWAPLAGYLSIAHQKSETLQNTWAIAQNLEGKQLLIYAGTLGLKHDPKLLLSLASGVSKRPNAEVVVISEGPWAEWLVEQSTQQGISNLTVLPFQPVEQVPAMLSSATILLSILEPGAGQFSVPSKVLSQFCAGRTMLASIPLNNDAAKAITSSGAGIVIPPGDYPAWTQAAIALLDNTEALETHGKAALKYAHSQFDSQNIARQFERILMALK